MKKKIILSIIAITIISLGIGGMILATKESNTINADSQTVDSSNTEEELEDTSISLVNEQYTECPFESTTVTINGKELSFPFEFKDLMDTKVECSTEALTFGENQEIPLSARDDEFIYNIRILTDNTTDINTAKVNEIKCLREITNQGGKSKNKIGSFLIGKTTYDEVVNICEPIVINNAGANEIIINYYYETKTGSYNVELSFINKVLEGYFIRYAQYSLNSEETLEGENS